MKPLAVIPTYVRTMMDVQVFEKCLSTLRETAGDSCEVVVVDDGSPARDLVAAVGHACVRYEADYIEIEENRGFSQTVNVGLKRAHDEGRDAILVNADIEFGPTVDWLDRMVEQEDSQGRPTAVVGALLLYPPGELIQHGGVWFSVLTRNFGHRFAFGPAELPEAQVPTTCPVTGALMFIRHECLRFVGPFDPTFKMGYEDVDYCCRVFLSGRECVYQPSIRAIHHESLFRGRQSEKLAKWHDDSWMRFVAKYAQQNFVTLVPTEMG
jgi:GT2 family glycosyltransferase